MSRTTLVLGAALALAALGAALALAACSSGAHSTSPARPSTSGLSTPSSSAANAPVFVAVARTGKGNALVGPTGHALYRFDRDTATASRCTAECITLWPPLIGTPQPGPGLDASAFGTITRADGSTQITYERHPLYYYARDSAAGDVTGDGVEGQWHLARVGS